MTTTVNFTDKQIDHFKVCFQFFDKNNVGTISSKDVCQVMRAAGINPSLQEIEDIVASAEQRGETLDFEEFCALVEQNWKDMDPEEELRNAFLIFDKEGNGFITQDELKKILQSLGEVLSDEEMKEMIKDCNVNTDGTINYEDFIKIAASNMQ